MPRIDEDRDLDWVTDATDDHADADTAPGEVSARVPGDDREHFREQMEVARVAGKLERVTVRLPKRNKDELVFWSSAQGLSMSEYTLRAIENQIARDNGKVDNETLVTGRMNQMIELMVGMEGRMANLEQITSQFMTMFSTLISGDTVLTDEEDGGL